MRFALGLAEDGEWVAASANDAGAERRLVLRGDHSQQPGELAAVLVAQSVTRLGEPEALAYAHRDDLDAGAIAQLRSALDAAGLSSCQLIKSSTALSFDSDLAVGAAIWAWRNVGGGSSVPGSLAGGAVGAATGAAAGASTPPGAGAITPPGRTMGDFGDGGSTMGDFARSAETMADLGRGPSIDDFGDGRQMSDFGAGHPPPAPTPAEATAPRSPKRVPGRAIAAAAVAAVVVVSAGAAVALTAGGGDERITSAAPTTAATDASIQTSTSLVNGSALWVGTIGYIEETPEGGHIRATWSVEPESSSRDPLFPDLQETVQKAKWIIEVAYDFTVERDGCTVRHAANEILSGEGEADLIHYTPGTRSDDFLGWEGRLSALEPAQRYNEQLTETCNGQAIPSERELLVTPDMFLTWTGEDPDLEELSITDDTSLNTNGLDFGSGTLPRSEFGVIRRDLGA